ncbi:hypothetical protein [Vibrio fluvialis]|uniref:hypothetical protein n=1 Tax=Vibrio fluvialis TaxID=676 RepID=UPI00192AECDC|nr:hypothetical protein [Vibrio fluvialis]MBL4240698.1 hypothetical protein [Vibrio fluvialis]MBL4267389.1 hypothetical protein [Vibrio fluvialis]MBL4271794.1 hypothetical protein [Vibrio fluvialis]MBL4276172.1 hypothetical protein [Vibrio fluvialis]MBO1443052.1 hypothetical protein [Vibrio fluvialis]
MISDQELNQLAENLHSSEVVFSWEYTGFGGHRAAKARWFMVITAGCIPLALLLFSELDIASVYFWINVMVCIGMVFAGRYLFLSDRTFCYNLTPVGIFYTEQVSVPESAYTFVRGFAWVGIAVCIVALFLIGPLAFVGVGGCALLSFGLTKFTPEVEELDVYFSDNLILFDPINDTLVKINSETEEHARFHRTVFFSSFEDKNNFIDTVKIYHNNVEYNKLKHINDYRKHPMFNRELQDG